MNLKNILWVRNTGKIVPDAPIGDNLFGMKLSGGGEVITTATGNPVSIITNKAQNAISTLISFPASVGGISSVSVGGCGRNIWDEEWELGSFDTDGNPTPSNNIIRSKNGIPVVPNTTYYIKGGDNNDSSIKYFYDSDGNYLGKYGGTGSGSFATPQNCRVLKFRMSSDYGNEYKDDISINYPLITTYEPYTQGTSLTIYLGDTYYNGGIVYLEHGIVMSDGVEHSIAPQTVSLLAGNNTLWTDGESLSVTYKAKK